LLLWRIPYIYSLFSEKGEEGEKQNVEERERGGGRVVGTVKLVIIF